LIPGSSQPNSFIFIKLQIRQPQRSKSLLSGGKILKDWEIIADNLSKAGWSYGYVSALDCEGRTIWIADAHRDDGKRFVVRADEKADGVFGTGITTRRYERLMLRR
jgi:hypothetical protein